MRSIEIEDAELLRQYFLGQLDAEATDSLELRLLADGELFELAEAMEGEILAAGARGELAQDENEAVLRRLTASPCGRERLALARGLNIIAGEQKEAKPHGSVIPFRRRLPLDRPAFRAAALAASLSVVVAGLWLAQPREVEDLGRAKGPSVQAQNEAPSAPARETSEAPSATPAAPQASRETPARPEPPVAQPSAAGSAPAEETAVQRPATEPEGAVQEIELRSDVTRSSGSYPVLDLPAGVRLARVRIILEGGEAYDSFTADVTELDTGDLITPESVEPATVHGGRVVVVSLSADKLSSEHRYRIMVYGVRPGEEPEPLGAPVFEVRAEGR